MTLSVDLFSFRSPYSYLALPKTLKMVADYDVAVNLWPVYPLAVQSMTRGHCAIFSWVSSLAHQLP